MYESQKISILPAPHTLYPIRKTLLEILILIKTVKKVYRSHLCSRLVKLKKRARKRNY